jgi:hypothetical protein
MSISFRPQQSLLRFEAKQAKIAHYFASERNLFRFLLRIDSLLSETSSAPLTQLRISAQ